MAVKNCFIRGSVVRYVQLPAEHVDTQLLEDATRRGAFYFALYLKLGKHMPDHYCSAVNRSCKPSQAVTTVLGCPVTITIHYARVYFSQCDCHIGRRAVLS